MSDVKTHPILFSAPMIQALLRDESPKTQTRRLLNPQPEIVQVGKSHRSEDAVSWQPRKDTVMTSMPHEFQADALRFCPYGKPGDLLIVRENWWDFGQWRFFAKGLDAPKWHWEGLKPSDKLKPQYEADGSPRFYSLLDEDWDAARNKFLSHRVWVDKGVRGYSDHHWRKRPSIHLPRWASRITLEITEIRVQRLQDMTDEDAVSEGIREVCHCGSYCDEHSQYDNHGSVAMEGLAKHEFSDVICHESDKAFAQAAKRGDVTVVTVRGKTVEYRVEKAFRPRPVK